ncbi:hypothetical protein SAMN04488601_1012440 [Paenibacillus sp. 453mf]|nr:hypothetical protein SAMN04488601_1012440 [Paenibacillus sp. 453mf]
MNIRRMNSSQLSLRVSFGLFLTKLQTMRGNLYEDKAKTSVLE